MGRVAVLKIGEYEQERGFVVSLQVWSDDSSLPVGQNEARLPAHPDLDGLYISWQTNFLNLTIKNNRHHQQDDDDWQIDLSLPTQKSIYDNVEACREGFRLLENSMNAWLQEPSNSQWQIIREKLVKEFANNSDEIRLVIQAEEYIWKLPWYAWNLLEQYPNVGIGFSYPNFEKAPRLQQQKKEIRVGILTVFGDNNQINLQPDAEAIEELPNTKTITLYQPRPEKFIVKLREKKGWSILFFAGHSQTVKDTGRIYLNETDSLAIADFKGALNEAIYNGLKIAVFNSCNGLALARELADLQIPVAIFMKEKVPDKIAHSFLKEFLKEYGKGVPLYTSVRRAQMRLEQFTDLPGCTELPIIYQNLAEVPPTWQDLYNKKKRYSGKVSLLVPWQLLRWWP